MDSNERESPEPLRGLNRAIETRESIAFCVLACQSRPQVMSTESWIVPFAGGVSLNLKVQPRASKNEIGPVVGDLLKLKVTAPPVDSAANAAVVALLAESLDCSKSAIELVRGGTSRNKVVRVHGLTVAHVTSKLLS